MKQAWYFCNSKKSQKNKVEKDLEESIIQFPSQGRINNVCNFWQIVYFLKNLQLKSPVEN